MSAHFAPFGEVTEVRIVATRETAQSQSFALVTMQTESAAENATKALDGELLGGRALRVCAMQGRVLAMRADTPERQRPIHSHTPSSGFGSTGRGLGARAAAAVPVRAAARAPARIAELVPSAGNLAPSGPDGERPKHGKRKSDEIAKTARITQQFRERHNMRYELDCLGVPLIVRIFFPVADANSSEWRIEAMTSDATDAPVAKAQASSRAQALQMIAEAWHDTMPATASKLDWTGIAQAMTAVRAL